MSDGRAYQTRWETWPEIGWHGGKRAEWTTVQERLDELHAYVLPYHITSHRITLHRITSHHTTQHNTTPHQATPCHTTPRHAMACHAMPCHAMTCHALTCHAMSYNVASHRIVSHRIASHRTASYRISWSSIEFWKKMLNVVSFLPLAHLCVTRLAGYPVLALLDTFAKECVHDWCVCLHIKWSSDEPAHDMWQPWFDAVAVIIVVLISAHPYK